MSAISIHSAGRPTTQDRPLGMLISRLSSALEAERGARGVYSISQQQAPNASERAALESRVAELQGGLSPAEPAAVIGRILRLMMRYPSSSSMSDARTDETAKAYARDMAKYPLWAIDAACIAAIGLGEQFMPSAPVIAGLAEKQVAPIRAELSAITRIIGAGVRAEPDEGSREQMRAAMAALRNDLAQACEPSVKRERPPTRQEAIEWLAERQAEPMPPPPMSDELRTLMGLLPVSKSEAA